MANKKIIKKPAKKAIKVKPVKTKKELKMSEPVIEIKNSEFKVGDEVVVSLYGMSLYPKWGALYKDKKGKLVKVKSKTVRLFDLGKDDKALYQQHYGLKEEYTTYELWVKIEQETFIASQFCLDKR